MSSTALPTALTPPALDAPYPTPASPVKEASVGADVWERVSFAIVAAVLLLAPALGSPEEAVQQHTLKAALVAMAVLLAGLALCWSRLQRAAPQAWHPVILLPLLLAGAAVVAMAWAHPFLAGAEAARWLVLAALLWLGANLFTRERLPTLAGCITWGAMVAAVWTALQFWFDLSLFPQGPNPASTFGNRNFFAEFAVVALPFSAVMLARARRTAAVAVWAAGTGLIVLAIMMTGTRGALSALWLLLLLMPCAAFLLRSRLACGSWTARHHLAAGSALLAVVLALGTIPTGNAQIRSTPERGLSALERAITRTASISAADNSLGVRLLMWKATARMIGTHPVAGVGAGAWESVAPLYQQPGAQVETDFFVHNEFLQLVAEFGIAGWVFLIGLLAYLARATADTFRLGTSAHADDDAPWRAAALFSLGALMVVSSIGFPLHLALTGALMMVALGLLAASDLRTGLTTGGLQRAAPCASVWPKAATGAALALFAVATAVGAWVCERGLRSEFLIVKAARAAMAVTESRDYKNPRLSATKDAIRAQIREGIAINAHDRRITPIVADEFARWGDWATAAEIWTSVVTSRPHVVVLLTNIARAHVFAGHPELAAPFLERARAVQPTAPVVRAVEVMVLEKSGQDAPGLVLARSALADGVQDFDLCNATFALASRAGDTALALQAMVTRLRHWPDEHPEQVYLQLGLMHAARPDSRTQATGYFLRALNAAPANQKAAIAAQLPPTYVELAAAAQRS